MTPDEPQPITAAMISNVEKISSLAFADAERELMLEEVNSRLPDYEKIRSILIGNAVPTALLLDPRIFGCA